MLSILSFQTIWKPEGKKWDTKEKCVEQKNVNQIHFKLTSNITCLRQQNQESALPNIVVILNVLSENWLLFLQKHVSFKVGCVRMHKNA